MCRQLGKPSLFLTLSCADNFWPDLLKLLDESYENNKKKVPTNI